MLKHSLVLVLLVGVLGVRPASGNDPTHNLRAKSSQIYESLLIKTLRNIRQGRVDAALQTIETLVRRNPKFKLAQLIYGYLLLARAQPIRRFGSPANASSPAVAALRHEAVARWQHQISRPPVDAVPQSLVQLPSSQLHTTVVDLARARLYLFANRQGIPHLVQDYYITSGKNGAAKVREGDQRTPVGVYFVTERLSAQKLPDLYGAGAFPINYPNEWDSQPPGQNGFWYLVARCPERHLQPPTTGH